MWEYQFREYVGGKWQERPNAQWARIHTQGGPLEGNTFEAMNGVISAGYKPLRKIGEGLYESKDGGLVLRNLSFLEKQVFDPTFTLEEIEKARKIIEGLDVQS